MTKGLFKEGQVYFLKIVTFSVLFEYVILSKCLIYQSYKGFQAENVPSYTIAILFSSSQGHLFLMNSSQ